LSIVFFFFFFFFFFFLNRRHSGRSNAGNILGNSLIVLGLRRRREVTLWLILRGEILLDVNHALGPHAIEFAPSRQAVCRCFDEMKAEGALDLMRETATSLRDCFRHLEESSSVCDIETLVFRSLRSISSYQLM
jgi:hypothetical protein